MAYFDNVSAVTSGAGVVFTDSQRGDTITVSVSAKRANGSTINISAITAPSATRLTDRIKFGYAVNLPAATATAVKKLVFTVSATKPLYSFGDAGVGYWIESEGFGPCRWFGWNFDDVRHLFTHPVERLVREYVDGVWTGQFVLATVQEPVPRTWTLNGTTATLELDLTDVTIPSGVLDLDPVAITGSLASTECGTANVNAFDVTVPNDADIIVVCVHGYRNTANVFTAGTVSIEGTACDIEVAQGNASTSYFMGAMFVKDVTALRGSTTATITWDWEGTAGMTNAVRMVWGFYKGVDVSSSPSSIYRDADGVQDTDMSTGGSIASALTASSGDLVVAWGWAYKHEDGAAPTWTSPMAAVTSYSTIYWNCIASWAEATATGDTTVAVTSWTNTHDGGICAIVLKPAATGVTETPGQGAITVTGQQPTLKRTFLTACAVGAMALAGQAPTVRINHNVAPANAAIVAAGEAPTLQRTYTVTPGQGAITATGEAPTLQRTYLVQPGQGALTVTGHDPTSQTGNLASPGQGSLALAGEAPTLQRTYLAQPGQGALTATGEAPTLQRTYLTQPGQGAIAATGQEPTVLQTVLTQPGQGALAFTGHEPSLQRTYLTQPGQGAITVAGEIPTATLSVTAELEEPGLGTLAFTGHAPTVTRDHTIPVGQGGLTVAGHTPSLAAFKIELRQDSTVITRWDLDLTSSLTTSTHDLTAGERATITDWSALRFALVATGNRVEVTWLELETPAQSSLWYAYPGVGSLALTGQQPYALLGGNYLIPVPHGSLTVTGHIPEAKRGGSFVVPVGQGALAFTGHVPTVTLAGSYTVAVPTGTLAVTGHTPVVPKFTLALLQGSTTIASWTWYPPATLGTWTYDLSAAERALITNWAILRYKLVANTKRVEVTWLELEVPAEVASNPSPAFASLAFAGSAPNVWVTGAKVPGTGDLGFAGHAPTLDAPGTERPGQGALTFAGQAPTISSPHDIPVPHGSLALAGQTLPNTMLRLYQGLTLKAERTLTLTDAFTTYNLVLTAAEFASITDWTTLQIAITADNVPVSVSWLQIVGGLGTARPAQGGLTFLGQAPTLARGYLAQPGAGSLALSGQAPRALGIQPPPAALALAGQAPTITVTVQVPAGALTFVGQAPTINRDHVIEVGTGRLVLGGHTPVPRQSGTGEIRPADMVGGLYTQGDRTGGVR